MDTLTHALTGAVLAEAGFRRRLGPRAVWFGAAMASMPDLDIFAPLLGEATGSLIEHRGITHAWFSLILASPLIGWAGHRWNRARADREASPLPRPAKDETTPPPASPPSPPPARGALAGVSVWILLTALAWASHILLDLTNAYGTMVWLPFSRERASIDLLPILDFVITGVVFLVWLQCRLLHRADRRQPPPASNTSMPAFEPNARRASIQATVALVFLTLYTLHGWTMRQALLDKVNKQFAAEGLSPDSVEAVPLMAVNRLWRVVARDGERIGVAVYSARAPLPALSFNWYPTLDATTRAELAASGGRVGHFLALSRGMFSAEESSDEDGGKILTLRDRRHGMLSAPNRSVFSIRLHYSPEGELAETSRLPMEAGVDLLEELLLTWRLFWSGDPGLYGNKS